LREIRKTAQPCSPPDEEPLSIKNPTLQRRIPAFWQPPHMTKAAAKIPGEFCHKCAKMHMTDSLQSRNRGVWFPQKTTQKPHNNTLFSWKTNI
jgi:hypothetical protein